MGGRRVVVATERPRYQWERLNPTAAHAATPSRWSRSSWTDTARAGTADPRGAGVMERGSGALEVTEYYTEPVRLSEVTVEGLP